MRRVKVFLRRLLPAHDAGDDDESKVPHSSTECQQPSPVDVPLDPDQHGVVSGSERTGARQLQPRPRPRPRPQPRPRPRPQARMAGEEQRPSPSRGAVQKCDFGQTVQPRRVPATSSETPTTPKTSHGELVDHPLPVVVKVVRNVALSPGPIICQEYKNPVLQYLNHSMQTQTSVVLDSWSVQDRRVVEELPKAETTAMQDDSSTSSKKSSESHLFEQPAVIPSQVRLCSSGMTSGSSYFDSRRTVPSAVLSVQTPSKEVVERTTAATEASSVTAPVHVPENGGENGGLDSSYITWQSEPSLETSRDALSHCASLTAERRLAGLPTPESASASCMQMTEENTKESPSTEEKSNAVTSLPKEPSATDSLGFPMVAQAALTIPYPCPCHPLDEVIRNKPERSCSSCSQVQEETAATPETTREVSGALTACQSDLVSTASPPTTVNHRPLGPAAFALFPTTTPDKISMRSLAAIAGQGVFQAVKEHSASASPPSTFLSFVPVARGPYDASEFAELREEGQSDQHDDKKCEEIPPPTNVVHSVPSKPSYSPTQFTEKQNSIHTRIGSILSQISADLCSLGSLTSTGAKSKLGSGEKLPNEAGSRPILKASRRASLRSKVSQPAASRAASKAVLGEELGHSSTLLDNYYRAPPASETHSDLEAGEDINGEDDPGSTSEDNKKHLRKAKDNSSLMTRRPPSRRARGRGRRSAKTDTGKERVAGEQSPRRMPLPADKVESLWVSPWTQEEFPSSNSILHVEGGLLERCGHTGEQPVPPQGKADASTAGNVLIGKVLDRRTRPPFSVRGRVRAAKLALPEPNVDMFECKVCTDYLAPPVRQCVGGHGLCAACVRERCQEERCPLCDKAVPAAGNPALDQLVRTVLFPCKNSGAGCKESYWIEDRTRHEAKCAFRPRPCPLATRSQVLCPWSGLRAMIRGHMRRAHGHHGVVYAYRTFFPMEDFNADAWLGRTYNVEVVFVEHEIFELHKVFDKRNTCLWGLLRHILARDTTAQYSYTIRFQPVNMRPVVSFRNDAVSGCEDLDKAFAQGKRFNLHLDCFTQVPLEIFTVQLKVQPRERSKWPP